MLNNVGFTFGSDWDNVSVAMDPTTLTATRQATSLILATQPHEISILRKVRERGGVILYNGAPVTTSWARAFKPTDAMYFAEDGEQCRVRFLHLSTPIALTRYSGGDSDIDPKYAPRIISVAHPFLLAAFHSKFIGDCSTMQKGVTDLFCNPGTTRPVPGRRTSRRASPPTSSPTLTTESCHSSVRTDRVRLHLLLDRFPLL